MEAATIKDKAWYDARTPVQQDYLIRIVTRIKAEILDDMLADELRFDGEDGNPEIHCWKDLSDQVDANSYGGLHDDSSRTDLKGLDLLQSYFPHKEEPLLTFMLSDDAHKAVDWIHEEVDAWLQQGGHTKAYAEIVHSMMTPLEYVIFTYALLLGVTA